MTESSLWQANYLQPTRHMACTDYKHMKCVLCCSSFSVGGILLHVCAWTLPGGSLCSQDIRAAPEVCIQNPKIHRAEPASPQLTCNTYQNKCVLFWVTKTCMLFMKTNTFPYPISVFMCMNLKLPRPHGCDWSVQNAHTIFPSKNMPFWQRSQREGFSTAIRRHIFCKTLFKFTGFIVQVYDFVDSSF